MIENIDQLKICMHFGSTYTRSPMNFKLGEMESVWSSLLPINGLRHKLVGDTTGWSIWTGEELSQADDFFQPVHVRHFAEMKPEVIPYLGLARAGGF